jgi:hypothetical protein
MQVYVLCSVAFFCLVGILLFPLMLYQMATTKKIHRETPDTDSAILNGKWVSMIRPYFPTVWVVLFLVPLGTTAALIGMDVWDLYHSRECTLEVLEAIEWQQICNDRMTHKLTNIGRMCDHHTYWVTRPFWLNITLLAFLRSLGGWFCVHYFNWDPFPETEQSATVFWGGDRQGSYGLIRFLDLIRDEVTLFNYPLLVLLSSFALQRLFTTLNVFKTTSVATPTPTPLYAPPYTPGAGAGHNPQYTADPAPGQTQPQVNPYISTDYDNDNTVWLTNKPPPLQSVNL